MDCSTPGFPFLHYLLEFAQIHVHLVRPSISMGLEQTLGFPTVVDTVICGPETPSLKDLLTQLLAVLSVESLQLSAPSGIASAVEKRLVQGHSLSPGRPTSGDGFMWEHEG